MLDRERICKIINKHSNCKCDKETSYCKAVEEIYFIYENDIDSLIRNMEKYDA